MSKHKERTLSDLYNVTFTLSQPKITPVLRGSYRMQGPLDKPSYSNFQANTVSTEVSEKSIQCPQNQSAGERVVSGTCNVCSTPCPSCCPTKQSLMESTVDEFSGETDVAVLSKLKDPKSREGLDDNMSSIGKADFSKMSDISSLQCFTSSGKGINNEALSGRVHVKNEAEDSSIDPSKRDESCGEPNSKAPSEATSSRNPHNTGDSEASGDIAADTCCPEKDDQKSVGSLVSSDTKDTLQSHQTEGSEDSEIEEQDVKVCDICGDAGREDLLAICCKCTDGAEHTYCMRVMVAKLPEGDWMCEECKFEKEMKIKKENKSVKFDGNGRTHPTGQTNIDNAGFTTKMEVNPSDSDRDVTSETKISSKRRMDDVEVSSVAKQQAFEPVSASPKTLSPNRPALSRESSFKNTDKGKLKSVNQISSGGLSVHDAPAGGSRLQSARGTFSKSNSFNSLAAKRKVQLVDEGFLPNQKSVRQSAGVDAKDSSIRSMNKSMSFRSVTTSRNNFSESKVKMISPKFSSIQDKGQMPTKERNPFERKNSFRSERSIPSKTDQRSAFLGDPSSLSSSSNNRDSRTGQLDSKPVSVLRSSSSFARRTQDVPVHSDEAKKQISHTAGLPAVNKISSSDQMPNQSSVKDDSYIAERPTANAGEGLSDGLSQQRESKNFGEKIRESSGRRLKHSGIGTKSELSSSDVFAVKNTKEAPNGTSDLKAAIEAAMLRKPGICRKNRVSDPSDDLAMSSTNSETPAQDQHPVSSSGMRLLPVPILPSDGKSSLVDLLRYSQAAMLMLSRRVIPEHEYIWQGAFEVQKSGRTFDLCDGIQAHLSSCASPKVLDTVNKFPQTVLFSEVSRLSTWPIQFQEYGVKEDNIALFFFAKDIVSYEGCYKTLLGNMISNDMALKANLDGVELLIFPSNQLPEKSQRWNTMFFLWGVFRVRKAGSMQHVQATGMPIPVSVDTPKSIVPLEPVDNVTSRNVSMESEAIASTESGYQFVNGNVDSNVSLVCKGDSSAVHVKHLEPSSVSTVPTSYLSSTQERRQQLGTSQVGEAEQECKAEVQSSSNPASTTLPSAEVQTSSNPVSTTLPSLNISEPVPMECDDVAPGHVQEKASVGSMEKGFRNTNCRKFEINLEDEYKDEEASEMSASATTEPTQEALSSDVLNHSKRPRSVESVMQSADSGFNHAHFPKKLKSSIGGSYSHSEQTSCSSDDLLSRMQGAPLPGTGCDEALSGADMPECSESAARFLFPVDPHPVKTVSSVPWETSHPETDRLRDRVPNLELALGGESNSPTGGIPSFLGGKVIIQDQAGESKLGIPRFLTAEVDKKIIQDQAGESDLRIPPFLAGKVDKKIIQDQAGESILGISPFLAGKADKKVIQDQVEESNLGIPPFLAGKVVKKIIQDQAGESNLGILPPFLAGKADKKIIQDQAGESNLGIPPFLTGKADKKVIQDQVGESSLGIPPFLAGKADKKVIQDQAGESNLRIPPFLVGVDKKVTQNHEVIELDDDDDDDDSASLSLSLTFPFSEKERQKDSVSQTEPEKRRGNTSLLFFGGLGKK